MLKSEVGALMSQMQEVITEISRNTSSVALKGSGDWVDEEDLNERYKNKPEQLAAVKKNCRRMWHPSRCVDLFKDMQFTTPQIVKKRRRMRTSANFNSTLSPNNEQGRKGAPIMVLH